MTRERSIIKDAVFAEDGQVVVCGSDHGAAYVFSCLNGGKKPLQIMYHGKGIGCERKAVTYLNALTNRETGCHGIRSAYGCHRIVWKKRERRLVGEATDDCEGVGLGAELGAVRDGLLLG
ncbi:uncharacterized protein EV420DRAFT_1478197 [Desarmillaria tabescens]|uniref:WD40 repeat-like protein n=1 Tax=Armillaria tabescens TaxID=1929756 RepID=A0AA39N7E5_ARMTA|nr:uncharacterized protein EV420DRAFT_1478197 [Desarmillaria tabescens]KAK0460414.1 hypothetical protein EV420DRAFT_1478197 [Desarmillaria tabescens]